MRSDGETLESEIRVVTKLMFAQKKILWMIGGAILAIGVIGGAGAGFAVVTAGTGDDDQPITGSALTKCSVAALQANPGGTVTETEVGDDGAAYGVEVRLEDGSQVEVNLDKDCRVIGQAADDDGPNDVDGPNDD